MITNVNKINALRVQQGLSKTELCKKAKISSATFNRLEKNSIKVRPEIVGKISIALGVELNELFI